MIVSTLITLAAILQLGSCVNLCSFPVGVSPGCDLSKTYICCNNISEDSCCGFDNSDGQNTGLGGSVLTESLPTSGSSVPAAEANIYSDTCNNAIGRITYNGCITFSGGNRAASAGWFYLNNRRRSLSDARDTNDTLQTNCQAPNMASYTTKDGIQRRIAIPDGHDDDVLEGVLSNNYTILDTYPKYAD
ncbi:uncharacterized protein BHQ10_004087 [Talaromyces amestolkiae]|uniref:Uncharacterized protein n=1 Tax=Talaromyces amestolkiae TaxID=1196081 RepID=A0A364KWZ8_TALAM|nr:uncharacterized protein BHQ10_004087 [Talaromyces amestolkiae]RAO68075.1 hypothetical protein BHQ10_004087 [Talaromyces amestolkiae]